MAGDFNNKVVSRWVKDDPVEEITFDRPHNSKVTECLPRKQRFARLRYRIEQRQCRNRFCNNGQIGVLQKKIRRLNVAAIRYPQKSIPEIAF